MTELEEITHLIDVLIAKGTQGTREQYDLSKRLIVALELARQFHSPTLGATPARTPLGFPDD